MIPESQTQKSLMCITLHPRHMIGIEDILGYMILQLFFRFLNDLRVFYSLGKNVRAQGLGSLLSCQCRGQGADGSRHC